jgi:bacterioferritin-associated ferredoxin
VLGVAAAPLRGDVAGLSVARDHGRLSGDAFARRTAKLHGALVKTRRFGAAMTMLVAPPAGFTAGIAGNAVVCRCEGLSRTTLDQAIDAGAVTLNDLKAATRCGMGPCGGRACEDVAAHLIAARTGENRAGIAPSSARPPLRPVPLAALAGTFDYADLPLPEPAPL